MLLMLAEVLRSCDVSAVASSSRLWASVCYEQTHAAWVGCSLHDLIQPGFYFLAGIGLLFSLRRRASAGQTIATLARHAVLRSLVLVFLGMALLAAHPRHWTWWFGDTLSQIGLAYPFLFLITLRPKRDWWLALGVVLIGYWTLFALFPRPPGTFDYAAAGVPPDWLRVHGITGFATHWQKNSNVAWAFDRWFLNLFPRDTPYTGSENGLTTLNFIPSIGTMVLGVIAGDLLQSSRRSTDKLRWLIGAGVLLLGIGWGLGATGIAPLVKAIWTPSWVLFSGGWCFLFLAGFSAAVDMAGQSRLAFPLVVIGLNSIVAYALSHLFPAFAFNSLHGVFGTRTFEVLGSAYAPALYGGAILAVYWLFLYVLYRFRIFVRI